MYAAALHLGRRDPDSLQHDNPPLHKASSKLENGLLELLCFYSGHHAAPKMFRIMVSIHVKGLLCQALPQLVSYLSDVNSPHMSAFVIGGAGWTKVLAPLLSKSSKQPEEITKHVNSSHSRLLQCIA